METTISACKFENGNWTECDPGTNQMRRVDTLKKATDPSCPETRVLTKKCGKNGKDKSKRIWQMYTRKLSVLSWNLVESSE